MGENGLLKGGKIMTGANIRAMFNLDDWSVLGKTVHRLPVADPQNVWLPLFICTGIVIITGLFAHRTVAQAGGASTMQFRHSTVPSILDDGTLIITADPPNTLYTCQGTPVDPIIHGIAIVPGAIFPFSVTSGGNIEVTMTAAAGTGTTEYWLTYMPVLTGNVRPI
jgi:hypothetical protein